jgi:hypothetical protein
LLTAVGFGLAIGFDCRLYQAFDCEARVAVRVSVDVPEEIE